MQTEIYGLCATHEERHWWYLSRKDLLLRKVRNLRHEGLLPSRPLHILDYGCGTGGTSAAFRAFGEVTAADVHPTALSAARARGLETVETASPEALQEGRFDLVCCLDVLEHVEDDAGLLSGLKGRLRPSGILLATVPAFDCLWRGEDVVSHHRRRYRAGPLRAAADRAGLEILELSYFNALLFPATLASGWIDRLRRMPPSSDVRDTPGWANRLLRDILSLEHALPAPLRPPFGASLLLVAGRPA